MSTTGKSPALSKRETTQLSITTNMNFKLEETIRVTVGTFYAAYLDYLQVNRLEIFQSLHVIVARFCPNLNQVS